jgi:hypothetical protein
VQLPAGAHDTERTPVLPPVFSVPVPGISIAACQVPLASGLEPWLHSRSGRAGSQQAARRLMRYCRRSYAGLPVMRMNIAPDTHGARAEAPPEREAESNV